MTQENTPIGILSVAVGSAVWVYNCNCRVYAKDASGRSTGGPIYRAHWEEKKIIGETSRSWIIGRGTWDELKVPKKGPHHGLCFSMDEVEDMCWVNDHRHKIAAMLTKATAAQLKSCAAVLGFSVPNDRNQPRPPG